MMRVEVGGMWTLGFHPDYDAKGGVWVSQVYMISRECNY